MSNDCYSGGYGEDSTGGPDPLPVNRYAGVTDSLDAIFDLLRDARRRYLLYYLFELEGPVAEFEAAVKAVRRYEAVGADDEPPSRETVRTDLHHNHLPRLADAGVVDYDSRQGTVRFRGRPALEELVEHAQYKEIDR